MSRKVAQPPGVLFARRWFLHRPSALQDLSLEVFVAVLFVSFCWGCARVFLGQFNAISN